MVAWHFHREGMVIGMLNSAVAEKTDYTLLSGFRRELRIYLEKSEALCRSYDLTPMQYQLLLDVVSFSGDEALNIGDLADNLQLTRHGILSLIDRCERMDLVQRYARAPERRKIYVKLLPAGARLVELLVRLHKEQIQSVQEMLATPACAQLCTSPICWKSSD